MPNSVSESESLPQTKLLPAFSEDLCLRTFIVTVIALSAIAFIVGILALLVAKGWSLPGLNSICSLSSIEVVNSYILIIGGFSLFVLGNLAWVYQIKHEKEAREATANLIDLTMDIEKDNSPRNSFIYSEI